jgi:pyrroloquinoline quinone biosynthesis protein E
MCGVWKTGDKASELKTEDIGRMADVLSQLGTQVISIGGGEPLQREDLPDAVRFFIKKDISVRVLTNGVIPDYKKLQAVVDAGVFNFSISLDTLDPKLQNDIIGRPDAFDRVMETFDFLSPIIKKNRGTGLINTVVSSANLDTLPSMVEFAQKKGFFVSFVPLEIHQFSGKILGCAETMQDLVFTKEDRNKAYKAFHHLVDLKAKGKPIFNSTAFLKKAAGYMSGKDYKWNCKAGTLYFSVSPEGKFSICHKYQGYTEEGNDLSILDPNFITIFNSPEYKEKAKNLQNTCRACLRPCWAEISNLFTDMGSLWEMVKVQR